MIDYFCKLEEGNFYHVYNHGNSRDNLFYNKGNYEYFLRKYDEYLSDYVETYAYCLLPNHFHLLVRVKESLLNASNSNRMRNPDRVSNSVRDCACGGCEDDKSKIISLQFSHFFNCYTQSVNRQQKRRGSLFLRPFKRKIITDANYLSNLVFYIHANAQLHGIIDDFRIYPWSSYDRILINTPLYLEKEKVLEWFSDKNNYMNYHSQKANFEDIEDFLIE